jgi:hypothetical protein
MAQSKGNSPGQSQQFRAKNIVQDKSSISFRQMLYPKPKAVAQGGKSNRKPRANATLAQYKAISSGHRQQSRATAVAQGTGNKRT